MKKILARILICVMVLGLVQIGNTAGTAKAASTDADIYYAVHCQTYGWGLGVAKNGEVTGTSGQAKRLESIKIWVKSELSGSVEYETHVQTYGWSIGTKKDSEECGTTGEAKRLEAIRIKLTGEMAKHYDIYYRVHAQSFGWLGWAKNGETAGTSGMAKRLEAIQIKLVPKNSDTSQFEDGKKAYIKGTPTANYSTQAQEVLAQCNAQRQANGIAALSLDPESSQYPGAGDCNLVFPYTSRWKKMFYRVRSDRVFLLVGGREYCGGIRKFFCCNEWLDEFAGTSEQHPQCRF